MVDETMLLMYNSRTLNYARLTFASNGPYVSEYKQTGDVDERGWYIFQWTENQTYFKYLQYYPKGFDDKGPVGVSEKYISHLMKFSQMLRSKHSFADVLGIAAQVSPSLRYYLLTEFRKRNASNIPQNVKEQCAAVNKELKNVILFPKEAKALEKKFNDVF